MKKEQQNIKSKAKAFMSNRKNANNLIDIIALLESDEDDVLITCIHSLHKIFAGLLAQHEMYFEKPLDDQDIQDLDANGKLKLWLRECYTDFRGRLLELLTHHNNRIQELALCTLMKLVEAECQSPLRKISRKHIAFPSAVFQQIIKHLISEENPLEDLIGRFQEYLEFDDVRYFSMKNTWADIKEKPAECMTAVYLGNVYNLLLALSMPASPVTEPLGKLLAKPPEAGGTLKMTQLKEHRKLFTSLWLQFLSAKLPTNLYKKVLVVLSDKVIPHMTSPLLLADFLTNSYNIGGAISLLALNGLFILVNAFNLEYPEFFKKLYALLEPSVFHVKYRARFFFLLDLFLTSTHLPGYLVAAFIKKLSRLLLSAPPSGITLGLPFIYNLVNRHPNCKVLLHRPDAPSDVSSDPFLMEEPDPAKCCALDSSLWEVKTLQHHYHHTIATKAMKINNPLNHAEIDLSGLLECSANDLFQQEVKKKMKIMPVTFDRPKGIFKNKEDKFSEFWLLE